jgi:hypothetical protein
VGSLTFTALALFKYVVKANVMGARKMNWLRKRCVSGIHIQSFPVTVVPFMDKNVNHANFFWHNSVHSVHQFNIADSSVAGGSVIVTVELNEKKYPVTSIGQSTAENLFPEIKCHMAHGQCEARNCQDLLTGEASHMRTSHLLPEKHCRWD